MKRSRILSWAFVASLLLALLVACGGGSDSSTTVSATATPASGAAAATSAATHAATATAQPSAAAEAATATAPEAAAATPTEAAVTSATTAATAATSSSGGNAKLVGKASVDDISGDIVNLLGNPPDDAMPGIDLRNVKIEADGKQVLATITTEGDIAAQLSADVDVSFDVHLWQDSRPAYAMSFTTTAQATGKRL